MTERPPASRSAGGFTLLELLLAITLMAAIASVTYFSFEAGTRAWRTGTELADSLHHADYVLEQIVMGLRSACYPDAARPSGAYGLTLVNDGDEAKARDTLGWVKLGTALVGADSPLADTPHRIELSVVDPERDELPEGSGGGLAIRAWRIAAQPEDFDPAESVKPMVLTARVLGFNCRVLNPENNLQEGDAPSKDDELKWDDEWEGDSTNRLPYAVEISLYLEPARATDDPIAVKRIVEIPLAPLAWRDKGAAGGSAETGASEGGAGARRPGTNTRRLDPRRGTPNPSDPRPSGPGQFNPRPDAQPGTDPKRPPTGAGRRRSRTGD